MYKKKDEKDDKSIPKSVKIGPLIYTIKRVKNLKLDKEKMNGLIEHSKCEILLDRDMNPILEKTILLHEIMHAILYNSGVLIEKEEVHQAIDTFGVFLLGLMKENKSLIDWLINDEKK